MVTRAIVSRWDDVPREDVRRGVSRQGFGTADVILVMNRVETSIEVRPHRHDDFDQIATIVSGEAIYHVGGAAHAVGPGSLLLIPAGVDHYIEPRGDEPVMNLDVFAPVRGDYRHLLDWMHEPIAKGV
jgi:quercetin dioxygenase-like cupin family protein